MSKQTTSYVTVGADTYPPGKVPPEVAKQIDNPKAFAVDTSGGDDAPGAVAYDDLKVDELRDLLNKRGLATDGVKADLVERLVEADTAAQG